MPPDGHRSLRPAFARLCRAGLDACMRPGAQIVATQRLMENRQRGAASAADEWQRRAELALRAGDEDLARAALTRRKSYQVLLGPGCSLFFVMVFLNIGVWRGAWRMIVEAGPAARRQVREMHAAAQLRAADGC